MAEAQNIRLRLPFLAARGSDGLNLIEFNRNAEPSDTIQVSDKVCRAMKFSKSGGKFAWCDGSLVQVLDTNTRNILFSKELPRTFSLSFSPNENLLTTWEPYAVTKEFPQGKSNLQVWDLSSGECVYDIKEKSVNNWEPVWVEHLNLCVKLIKETVHFYKDNNFKKSSAMIKIEKMERFSLVSKKQCHIACFSRGAKGAPSSVRVYKYPRFSRGDVLAHKSFYKADTVDLLWNAQGTGLLVKTALEIDTTGESYYGEQNLHFMTVKGDTAIVTLSKKGPIYDAAWAPNSPEFCVVFGFMPAKACIFDLKCNPVFEFGPTPKNALYFNPQGNLLTLAGFGNLRGNVEIWDFEKRRQVAQYQSPDTTHFEWCADGAHFVTATTSPRLRVGNGYKVWNFKDGVKFQLKVDKELHDVQWQPKLEGTYKPPAIGEVSKRDLKAIINASKPPSYVPPHARNNPAYAAAKNRLEEDEDTPIPEKPLSKSAQKRKRRKEKDGGKSAEGPSFTLPTSRTSEQQDAVAMAKYLLGDAPSQSANQTSAQDIGIEKRMKTLKKKLTAIEKLKREQKEGKELDSNQITKIKSEAALREEFNQLQINS